jgi:hypothetical protein
MTSSIGVKNTSATGTSGFTTGSLGSLLAFVNGIGYPYTGPGPKLGEGFPGIMPSPTIDHDNSGEFARTRFALRNSWNTSSYSGSSNSKRIITPFRAVNNAGDLLSRENYSCGGYCQTAQSIPNINGLKNRIGGISHSCQPSVLWSAFQVDQNIPSSTCNVKYVYDGSDYTKFKRDQTINKNYNDRSFGGNESNASQSVIRRSKRY